MALGAVAAAEQTLEGGIEYAKERQAFGRPGRQVPGVAPPLRGPRHRDRGRPLAHVPRAPQDRGRGGRGEGRSMAKWFSTELSWRVADEALQVHGGYGFMMEFPVQRAWRDSRLGPIGGGTTEIMKEIIGRLMGL